MLHPFSAATAVLWRHAVQTHLELANEVRAAANHDELRAQLAHFIVHCMAQKNPVLAGRPVETQLYIANLTPHIAFILSIQGRLQDVFQLQNQGKQSAVTLEKALADFQKRLTRWGTEVHQVNETTYSVRISSGKADASSIGTRAHSTALIVRPVDSTALHLKPPDANALTMIYPRALIPRTPNFTAVAQPTPRALVVRPPDHKLDPAGQFIKQP
jgi:hypothetical protein